MVGNANSMQEFKALVREALDELDDLRASIEYDEDYMGGAMGFLDELDAGVRQLYERIESGSYHPGEGELPFMEVVRNAEASLLPCKHLFLRIEETHKKGFDTAGLPAGCE